MSDQPVRMHDFLADVMGAKGIVGVPPEIALDALRKTAIDFCVQSSVWTYEGQLVTQANVSDYPLYVPEGARVAQMLSVEVNGNGLSSGAVQSARISWNSRSPNSLYGRYGYSFTMEGRDVLWITPTPTDDTSQVVFSAALKPTQQSCELPDILYEDWNDAMTSGTAFRLFSIPKQEWSNQALAMMNSREYSRWIARARLAKAQNFTNAPMILSGSYF